MKLFLVSLTVKKILISVFTLILFCSIVCGKPCYVSLDFCACCRLPCSSQDGKCDGVIHLACASWNVHIHRSFTELFAIDVPRKTAIHCLW